MPKKKITKYYEKLFTRGSTEREHNKLADFGPVQEQDIITQEVLRSTANTGLNRH